MIKSINEFSIAPKSDKIDVDGLTRRGIRIIPTELSDAYYMACRDITRNQYMLPIKYLRPVKQTFRYAAKKSSTNSPNIKDADLVCEPLNPDIKHCISYTPINQDLPVGEIIYIDESIPYDADENGNEQSRQFLSSDNLQSTYNKKFTGIYKNFCIQHCDYNCAMDIGSEIFCKFEVDNVDGEKIKSMTIFTGPRRHEEYDDNDKPIPSKSYFEILVYQCWNRTPLDVFKLMKSTFNNNVNTWSDQAKTFIDEVIDKLST